MSYPVSHCLIYKAALGDNNAFMRLVEAMEYNLRCGHCTIGGCSHTPPCPQPTDQQIDDLDERVAESALALRKKIFMGRPVDKKTPPGSFEKLLGPVPQPTEPGIQQE